MFKINCMLGLILIAQFTLAPAQSDDDPDALVSSNIVFRSNGHKYVLKPVYVKHVGPNVSDASLIDVIKLIMNNVNNDDATSAPPFHIEDSSSQESDELNHPYVRPSGSVLPNVQKIPETHVHSMKHYFEHRQRPINQINSNEIDQNVIGKPCLGLSCSTYDRLVDSLKQNRVKKVQKLNKILSQVNPQKVARSYVYTLH